MYVLNTSTPIFLTVRAKSYSLMLLDHSTYTHFNQGSTLVALIGIMETIKICLKVLINNQNKALNSNESTNF